MQSVTLLKLGGSLITDKSKPYTARMHVIKDLVRQIKEALSQDRDLLLIIGNGAGSYAHYPATLYKMSQGIVKPSQKMGFCKVQDGASRLNRIIVSALLESNVEAISLSPSSFCTARGGKIHKMFLDPLVGLLKKRIVPVLYGDIIYDELQGSAIVSTEVLLSGIAKKLLKKNIRVRSIIHNGVTKGVMDLSGKVIPKISRMDFRSLKKVFTSVKGYDVTGGMMHKVKESLALTRYGIKSSIINGTSEKNLLKRALLGDVTFGTRIE